MQRQIKAGLTILLVSYFGACAPVSFDTKPENKVDNVVVRCEGATCFYDVTEERTVGESMVDILIVNDNSGSMSFEQAKMATAFTGFLASINSLDYRIAMTTTDVQDNRTVIGSVSNLGYNPAGPYNGYGALQDGKLIDFGGGITYLDRSTYNKDTLFSQTVKHQETIQCESSYFSKCPSGDERGIAALSLTIKNYLSSYARPTAHFAVIILADEDERGVSKYNPCAGYSGADKTNCEAIKSAYPFQPEDEPQAAIDAFRATFPSKTMSVHSIIVKPGDYTCRAAQTNQVPAPLPVLGQEGYAYAKLTEMTGGKLGNICETNYTNQLQNIGAALPKIDPMPFRCRPTGDKFTVTYDGQVAGAGTYTANFTTMMLTFSGALNPATKIKLTYSCVK